MQQRIKYSLPLVIRILAYAQVVLSLLIFAMEIGIIICYSHVASIKTSQHAKIHAGPLTAAGIWTSVVMDIAIYFLFKLRKKYVSYCVCAFYRFVFYEVAVIITISLLFSSETSQ